MRRLLLGPAILASAALLFLSCETPIGIDTEEADRRNQEVMATLPVYSGATLVETYVGGYEGTRWLGFNYATATDAQAVLAFYQGKLQELGWTFEHSEGSNLTIFGKDNAEVVLYLPAQREDRVTPVASAPPGAESFFTVRVSNR